MEIEAHARQAISVLDTANSVGLGVEIKVVEAQATLSPVLAGRLECTANVGQGACPVFVGP